MKTYPLWGVLALVLLVQTPLILAMDCGDVPRVNRDLCREIEDSALSSEEKYLIISELEDIESSDYDWDMKGSNVFLENTLQDYSEERQSRFKIVYNLSLFGFFNCFIYKVLKKYWRGLL